MSASTSTTSTTASYSVYVIEVLDQSGAVEGLYVGATSHALPRRLEQHESGGRMAARVFRGGGRRPGRLRPDLLPERARFRTRARANAVEADTADVLRRRGFRVWGGH